MKRQSRGSSSSSSPPSPKRARTGSRVQNQNFIDIAANNNTRGRHAFEGLVSVLRGWQPHEERSTVPRTYGQLQQLLHMQEASARHGGTPTSELVWRAIQTRMNELGYKNRIPPANFTLRVQQNSPNNLHRKLAEYRAKLRAYIRDVEAASDTMREPLRRLSRIVMILSLGRKAENSQRIFEYFADLQKVFTRNARERLRGVNALEARVRLSGMPINIVRTVRAKIL